MEDEREIRTVIELFRQLFNERIIPDNKRLLTRLSRNKWAHRHVEKATFHIHSLERDMARHLEKASELVGQTSRKTMPELLGHLRTFERLLDYSKREHERREGHRITSFRKSLYETLDDLYRTLKEEGYDNETLAPIADWFRAHIEMCHDARVMRAFRLLYGAPWEDAYGSRSLWSKTVSYFRKSRPHLPKIDEVIHLRKEKKLHLLIYFDSGFTKEKAHEKIDEYARNIPRALAAVARELPSVQRFLLRVQERVGRMRSFDDTVQDLFRQLRDVIVRIFEEHPEKMVVPALTVHLRIMPGDSDNAGSDSLSTPDTRLLKITLGMIVSARLLCEDFYETFPSEVLRAVESAQKAGMANPTDVFRKGLRSHANRSDSIYNTLLHEIEHGADWKFIAHRRHVMSVLNPLLYDFGNLHVTSRLVNLVDFYITLRNEATTQLQEQIALEDGKYHIPAPLTMLDRYMVDRANSVIDRVWEGYGEFRSGIGYGETLEKPVEEMHYFRYEFSYILMMTIVLAELQRRKADVTLLTEKEFDSLCNHFPQAGILLRRTSGLYSVSEGSPDHYLVESLREGNQTVLRNALRAHDVSRHTLDDIPAFGKERFCLFKPSPETMKLILDKIRSTNELQFFDLYIKSCKRLGLRERLSVVQDIPTLAQPWEEAHRKAMRRKGYIPT